MAKLTSRQNEIVKRLRAGVEIRTMDVHWGTWHALTAKGVCDLDPTTCLLSLKRVFHFPEGERRSPLSKESVR